MSSQTTIIVTLLLPHMMSLSTIVYHRRPEYLPVTCCSRLNMIRLSYNGLYLYIVHPQTARESHWGGKAAAASTFPNKERRMMALVWVDLATDFMASAPPLLHQIHLEVQISQGSMGHVLDCIPMVPKGWMDRCFHPVLHKHLLMLWDSGHHVPYRHAAQLLWLWGNLWVTVDEEWKCQQTKEECEERTGMGTDEALVEKRQDGRI